MQSAVRRCLELQNSFLSQWMDQRYGEAEVTAQAEWEAAQKAFGDEHPAIVRALLDQALAAEAAGRKDQSKNLHEKAIALFDRLRERVERNPEDPLAADVAIFEADQLWTAAGNIPGAREQFQKAITLLERRQPPDLAATAQAVARLAEFEDIRADFPAAEKCYRRAVELFGQAGEADDPYVEKSFEGLGRALLNLNRPDDAWPFLERALDWSETFELHRRSLYFLLQSAAKCRREMNDSNGAELLEERAASLLPKANPGAEGFHV